QITRTLGLVFNGYSGSAYGVVDHNIFDIGAWGLTAITGWHSGWGGKLYGDGSWAAPRNLGFPDAVYIEDNLFRGQPTRILVTHGAYGGWRFVMRYNRFENAIIGSHGTESTQRWRGGRLYEVYQNTFRPTGGGRYNTG